jgi:hypothetical protein
MISLNDNNNQLDTYSSVFAMKPSSSSSSSSPSSSTAKQFLSKYSLALPLAIASLADTNHMTPLDASYQPGAYDVVCGRGKGSYNRPGNKRFRSFVATYIPQYISARTKVDKSMVLNTIIDQVHSYTNPDTGLAAQFVKYTKDAGWVMIGDEHAREKVGHAIREAIAAQEQHTNPNRHPSASSSSSSPVPSVHDATTTQALMTKKQLDLLSQQQLLFSSMRMNTTTTNTTNGIVTPQQEQQQQQQQQRRTSSSCCSSEMQAAMDALLVGV